LSTLKKFTWILTISAFIALDVDAQGHSSLFMGGYDNDIMTLPWGGNKVDFSSGQATIGQEFRIMDFNFTGNTISDTAGNFLFATNGVTIMNHMDDTMANVVWPWLNPSSYTINWQEGLRIWQQNVIIPAPDSIDLYYIFHNTVDDPIDLSANYVYFSKVDMTLNGGEGEVVIKNEILISDTLSPVGTTACKHGNGRDWWILYKDLGGSKFHFILLTPNGPIYHHNQQIGSRIGSGQYCFSPDGTRLGSYSSDDDFEIFDFDRCTGMLSNLRHLSINDSVVSIGAAFSPNSKYLYGSSAIYLYQIDASSNLPDTSLTTVAVWDGTYSPNPPLATTFFIQQLANDGKIYITSGNGTLMMHTIEDPNLADTLCNVQQHSIALPTYNTGTIPNFPNYNLGPLIGSPCDTLVGIHEIFDKPINLTISPNPNNGQFEVNYELPQNEQGALEVINILGEVIYRHQLVQWSNVHLLNLEVSSGMYQVIVTTSKTRESKKIIIQ
jgi:type IX secretion system substrate protein